jgi:outer membrane protein assembly factor BamB
MIWTVALLLTLSAGEPDQWPRWRGPADDGMARGGAPLEWSEGKNIAWKADVPGLGHSSPVIWGDQIFLTTAVPQAELARRGGGGRGPGGGFASGVPHELRVMSLDRKTGKVRWSHSPKTVTPHEGYHFRYGSFASNSPVTDGKVIITFFGSFGAYAYDLQGKLLWQKEFPPQRMRNEFGEGTAAVLDGETVIFNLDQEGESFITAVDRQTGKELWRTPREERSSWSAPLVVTHQGKKQIIVAATNKVRAYEFQTGKVIWECAGLGANVIPAPVIQKDVVYVMSGFRDPNLMAIKLGRTGDLTGTDAILWQNKRGNSYTPSPVLHQNRLYFVTDNGMVSCLNATTGEVLYQQRLPKPYNIKASPVGANGRLYVSTEAGDVVVLKLGDQFEVLATNTLADEVFIATPAVADGEIYLRSQKALYCVRERR